MNDEFASCVTAFLVLPFLFFILMLTFNDFWMHANVKPGEHLHVAFYGMLIFFPSRLNEKGKRARKLVLISWLGLAIIIGVILFLAWVNGVFDQKVGHS